jgi:hypothetical protein
LRKIAYCYDVLKYGILLDYFNCKMDNIEYLLSLDIDYITFVRRWLHLPITNDLVHKYWKKCMAIIQG